MGSARLMLSTDLGSFICAIAVGGTERAGHSVSLGLHFLLFCPCEAGRGHSFLGSILTKGN